MRSRPIWPPAPVRRIRIVRGALYASRPRGGGVDAARGEPRLEVAGEGAMEDIGVLAGRGQAPGAVVLRHDAGGSVGVRRVAGAVAALELGEHQREVGVEDAGHVAPELGGEDPVE